MSTMPVHFEDFKHAFVVLQLSFVEMFTGGTLTALLACYGMWGQKQLGRWLSRTLVLLMVIAAFLLAGARREAVVSAQAAEIAAQGAKERAKDAVIVTLATQLAEAQRNSATQAALIQELSDKVEALESKVDILGIDVYQSQREVDDLVTQRDGLLSEKIALMANHDATERQIQLITQTLKEIASRQEPGRAAPASAQAKGDGGKPSGPADSSQPSQTGGLSPAKPAFLVPACSECDTGSVRFPK